MKNIAPAITYIYDTVSDAYHNEEETLNRIEWTVIAAVFTTAYLSTMVTAYWSGESGWEAIGIALLIMLIPCLALWMAEGRKGTISVTCVVASAWMLFWTSNIVLWLTHFLCIVISG